MKGAAQLIFAQMSDVIHYDIRPHFGTNGNGWVSLVGASSKLSDLKILTAVTSYHYKKFVSTVSAGESKRPSFKMITSGESAQEKFKTTMEITFFTRAEPQDYLVI